MYSAHLDPIVPSTHLVAPRSWHWALDGHPPTNNQILRMDWRKRHRTLKPWKEQTILLVRSERPRQPLAHASVVLTLAYLRKPFRDLDGAYACLKFLVDSLVQGGIIEDDSPEYIALEVRQVLGHRKQVLIDVVEVIGG